MPTSDACANARSEWDSLRNVQASLAALGPVPEPQICRCAFASP